MEANCVDPEVKLPRFILALVLYVTLRKLLDFLHLNCHICQMKIKGPTLQGCYE